MLLPVQLLPSWVTQETPLTPALGPLFLHCMLSVHALECDRSGQGSPPESLALGIHRTCGPTSKLSTEARTCGLLAGAAPLLQWQIGRLTLGLTLTSGPRWRQQPKGLGPGQSGTEDKMGVRAPASLSAPAHCCTSLPGGHPHLPGSPAAGPHQGRCWRSRRSVRHWRVKQQRRRQRFLRCHLGQTQPRLPPK